jgi:zinc protease
MRKLTPTKILLLASVMALPLSAPMVPAAFAQAQTTTGQTKTAQIKTAWGYETPDLTPDPQVRFGVLPNGMKYALQHNETPKDSVAVRMQVAVGSIAEAEEERGLAHFLEHLAFNGSVNIPEGEMTKILERKGLAFGADTNASTGFEETTYMLNLPQASDDLIGTALFIMRETASELTMSDGAVERERGVVLSEKQTRDSADLRRFENLLQFVLPDAPFGTRLPIGTEQVLKTAPASRIKNFYQRYYRPENTTMVIVGDFDMAKMEAAIKAKFSDWAGKGPAGTPLNRGILKPATAALATATFSDPATSTAIELMHITPIKRKIDSVASRQGDIAKNITAAILGQRLQNLGLAKKPKIRGGSISFEPLFNSFDQASLSIDGNDGDWQGALAVGEQELRRAIKFGVTQAEIDEQLANMETDFRNAAQQTDSRRSEQLAERILDSMEDKSIVTTPQSELELFAATKPMITVKAINTVLKEQFPSLPKTIHVSSKLPIANADQAIGKTIAQSRKIAVSAPVTEKLKPFAYESFGKAGNVVKDERIEDLGIRTILFANNVRLNIKKTDFEKGVVRYGLRFGEGEQAVPQGMPGLDLFMEQMSPVAGLKAHSFDELQKILAGRTVKFGLDYNSDSFGTSGSTTPQDGALQLKLLAASMVDGGYRAEADSVWQNAVKSFGAQLDAQPSAVSRYAVPRLLMNGDTRFGIANASELAARNIGEVKTLLAGQITGTPIEIAIIGDVGEDEAIKWVADSFGALPARRLVEPTPITSRKISFTTDKGPVTLYHKGKDDQGSIIAYWPTTDNKDQKSAIIRTMTSEVLGSLLLDEVREKLGATYSPRSSSFASDTYDGYGYFNTRIVAEPAKMDIVMKAIRDITKTMRDAPVSEDNILRARQPLIEQLEKSDRENGAWLGLVNVAQSQPDKLDRRRARMALLNAVTAADIQKAAQQYLTDDAQITYRIVAESLKE